MRETLFKGQDTQTKEWREGDLIHGVGAKYGRMYILPITHIYPPGCNSLDGWEVIPETVGQFTGLTDKNGVKIFEGDICRDTEGKDMVVLWSKKFASWVLNRKGWAFSHWFGESCNPEDTEVVGNIHDNPELLKP